MIDTIIDIPKRVWNAFVGIIYAIIDSVIELCDYLYDLSTTNTYTEIFTLVILLLFVWFLIQKRKSIFYYFEKLSLVFMVGCLLVLYVIHRIAEVFINPFRSLNKEKHQ